MKGSEKYDKITNISLHSYAKYSVVYGAKYLVIRPRRRIAGNVIFGIIRVIAKNGQMHVYLKGSFTL
jgi:hypothetical protein